MKKHILLQKIEAVRLDAELKEIENGTVFSLLDLLLEYLNDRDIKKAVEGVPM